MEQLPLLAQSQTRRWSLLKHHISERSNKLNQFAPYGRRTRLPPRRCRRSLAAMSMVPSGFNKFELSPELAASLLAEFRLIIEGSDLSRCIKAESVISSYKKVPGIYFWVMRHEARLFSIYIGKTNSMSYRMQNYVGEFQPHSPNDYKLRIFHNYLVEIAPGATLDLFFCERSLEELTHAENRAVAKFAPLLNQRQRPSREGRALLRDAFSAYYRSSFEKLVQDHS